MKVIFLLNNQQFSVLENTYFFLPKYRNYSIESFNKDVKPIICLDDNGWKAVEKKISFIELEEIKGKKVLHFRKARRNSRDKKKGFRSKILKAKISLI